MNWAQECLHANRNIDLILLGALPPKEYADPELHQNLSGALKSTEAADRLINELSFQKRREPWGKPSALSTCVAPSDLMRKGGSI